MVHNKTEKAILERQVIFLSHLDQEQVYTTMNDDIHHILETWRYDPSEDITVRLIEGDDGTPKIQMRVDMGVIQMNLDGHPAGEKTGRFDSWLEYYESARNEYESSRVDDYFSLSSEDCSKLRREGVQYYYRYLSLLKLRDFTRVVRDTDRNMRLFAFVRKYAAKEVDKWSLDQFRPYVIMMNTRAKVSITLSDENEKTIDNALEYCDEGIGGILCFFNEYGLASEIENSVELSILKALKSELLQKKPESLDEKLQRAIQEERFEDAALLRDEMKRKNK
jgi:hypothetical protein